MSLTRPLVPRSAAYVMTVILVAFMFLLAVRGFFQPLPAASGFGIALADVGDAAWLHVKAGRDLSVGLMLTALLITRHRAALFGVIAASLAIPINDGFQVVMHDAARVGYALGVHGSAVLYGVALLATLARGG